MIYLDAHATTPLDPRVLEAMTPYFLAHFGNAASRQHAFGWRAEKAVETARGDIAGALGIRDPREIVFTSGATEANNLAIKGVPKGHMVSVVTEHASVLDAIEGATLVPVDAEGFVSPQAIADALRPDTVLVSVMLANNEIGVLQPIKEIADVCHARGVWLMTDASQAVGKIPVNVEALGVDLMTFTAHKLHGPKGVGALWAKRTKPKIQLHAQIQGGGHERGLRSGTLNVPGIVGFAHAVTLAVAALPTEMPRLAALRDKLRDALLAEGALLNGPREHRLPHNLNVSFAGVDGEALILAMKDIAVSSGSACASQSLQPSHVLRAIGRPHELAHAALRFGLHRFTVEADIDHAAKHVIAAVRTLRAEHH